MTYKVAHFINGKTIESKGKTLDIYNPATGSVIGEVALADQTMIDKAVAAAKAAFPAWSATTPLKRARILFKFKALLEKNLDELAKLVTQEHGKTFVDAQGSVQRGIDVVEFVCGIPNLLKGNFSEDVATEMDSYSVRQPLGVCVGITPFNFPVMVPLWMYPVALACGNTFVLKPSEKVPLSAILLGELLEQAGLPKGVFNIVHGGRECVDALLTHPQVRAISFVGSSPIAKYIYETGTRHGKRVQANGGAKNYIVIMPDADMNKTVENLATAAFGCAGERCMAGSTALTVGAAADRLLPSLVEAARRIRVGPTDREAQPDMGPVITSQHKERVESLIGSGESQGARVVCDGRGVRLN